MCQLVCILSQDEYKPGDPPPPGNHPLAMQEWADVQLKAGLQEQMCGACERFYFPQELSAHPLAWVAYTRRGRAVGINSPLCLGCAEKRGLTNA